MKKKLLKLIYWVSAVFLVIFLLNSSVTIRQGVDFKVHIVRLPLYLKLLDFFDRHYNYKIIATRIIDKVTADEERALKIFLWTHEHVKPQPKELPVIDDHVWNIIIRGYGTSDQSADVFATLCNYAGLDAFFSRISNKDNTDDLVSAFVKIKNKWYIFDPYNGVYFMDLAGRMMDLEGLRTRDAWLVRTIGLNNNLSYVSFFENLPLLKDMELRRSNIQSPFKRLLFEVRKWLR